MLVHSKKSTSPVQKKDAPTASSVLDSSSQSEGLQRKADMANNAAQREEAPRTNNTGMPDNLKAGIESLSGFSMDDVRVHYNSSKPATVQALAYTQGTDIHVAPGQEKHLPHEAWHVAQQMAGRVAPTTNINGMPVNDNASLEHEADVMGEKAVQRVETSKIDNCQYRKVSIDTAQLVRLTAEQKENKRADAFAEATGINYDVLTKYPGTKNAKEVQSYNEKFFDFYKTGVFEGIGVDRDFEDELDFQHQAAQDYQLYKKGLNNLIGEKHSFDDFSYDDTLATQDQLKKGISLSQIRKVVPTSLKIYRTFKLSRIAPNGGTVNIFGPKSCHGGSLGTALSYVPSNGEDYALVKVVIDGIKKSDWEQMNISSQGEGLDAKTEAYSELRIAGRRSEGEYAQFSVNFCEHRLKNKRQDGLLKLMYQNAQTKNFFVIDFSINKQLNGNDYDLTDGTKTIHM